MSLFKKFIEILLINVIAFFISTLLGTLIADMLDFDFPGPDALFIHFFIVLVIILVVFLIKSMMKFFIYSILFQLLVCILLSPGWDNDNKSLDLQKLKKIYKDWYLEWTT